MAHPINQLRKSAVVALKAADLKETILDHPPEGAWVSENKLPAIYCFVDREVIEEAGSMMDRTYHVHFIIQAKGSDDKIIDEVDRIHELLEKAFIKDRSLGGLVHSFEPISSDLNERAQASLSFGMRRVTYRAKLSTDVGDPTVII